MKNSTKFIVINSSKILLIIVSVLSFSPVFFNYFGFITFNGDFPPYFLNVDNAWYYQFIHSFNGGENTNIEYLAASGPAMKYQYGLVYFWALLNLILPLKSHIIFFIIIPIILRLIIALYAYKIASLINEREVPKIFILV